MNLRGQHGYAMAALLVAMSVAAVLVSALMPTWKTMSRREKEAELVFRGEQYVRAIGLFQRRAGPGVLPPSVDVLVTQRFLRKKYKDPITGQDFDVLSPTTTAGPGAPGGRGIAGPTGGRGAAPANVPGQAGVATGTGLVAAPQGAGGGRGGVMGVVSRSKDSSLRLYNGRTKYNEWQFVYVQQAQAPAAGAPGARGGIPPQGGAGRGGARGFGPGGGTASPPVPGQRGSAPVAPAPQPLGPRPLR